MSNMEKTNARPSRYGALIIMGVLACMAFLLAPMALTTLTTGQPTPQKEPSMIDKARKASKEGNFKVAFETYEQLFTAGQGDSGLASGDLDDAVTCLNRLNQQKDLDAFLEKVIAANQKNWRLLVSAARHYSQIPHQGFIVAGKFERGPHRGQGRVADAFERDRVRAMQILADVLKKTEDESPSYDLGEFHMLFARLILMGRQGHEEAWRLQALTDLAKLPDYEEGQFYGYRGYGGQTQGAPVDEKGQAVFHYAPKSWEESKTDGERWRWLLKKAEKAFPSPNSRVPYEFAQFLWRQFDVQTMAGFGYQFGRAGDDTEKQEGVFALHTLKEDETIARLATGIKRFPLPDEFNFIRVFQTIGEAKETGYSVESLTQLGRIFENRRQYDRAVGYWRQVTERLAASPLDSRYKDAKQHLAQILDNWGQFEPVMSQPADGGATVEFRFRNGTKAAFEARAIKVAELLADVKSYIKSAPNRLDSQRINIQNIGYRLVEQDEKKYVGEKVASWSLDLQPRPSHFDSRVTVTTPLQKAGAYLLTARMGNGNVSRIILWLEDTAIAKKQLDGKVLYYVADARTGKPLEGVNLEFFGYKQEPIREGNVWTNRYNMLIKNFAENTDPNGFVIPDPARQPNDYQWIITATTPQGRLAYLGFTNVWYGQRHDEEYNQVKVFTITDRPVYRPGQPVKFKFWVRQAQYDQEDTSSFANQTFPVEIHNPKGDKILEKSFTADAYGGFDGEFPIPADATLGVYSLSIPNKGGGSFRVEEYKKPEFEVTVEAPTDPVMLGEKITATVKATYYFGEPVKKGKVKYKVQRSGYSADWYPMGIWDWFYGRGYWWFAYDYDWYPGWHKWGCIRPAPWWYPRPSTPPELVMENEVPVGEDGTVKIEIDTLLAKEMHGNQDHRYEITAEVTDESRRTITGQGAVLVAREPFKVYAWVDHGHYRVGDTIEASFQAQTLDSKPVQGKGFLELLRITAGEKSAPKEDLVQKWDLNPNAEGLARQQIKASDPGQYRLSYKLTDSKDHTIEGGYIFTIMGQGTTGGDFRFNDIELVPDKREYANGDKVRLQINTNRRGGTVLLFVRPANGVYLPPKVLRLEGKTTIEEIEVSKKDMPNFFVEALTISDGRVHTETREIVVPPEQRILNLEVKPSATEYKPGEKAKIALRLTGPDGKPFVGSTVLTVYDKALEYISGGSNVPEIKEFFWKWRRHHNPSTETNLGRWFANLLKKGEIPMQSIGVFGRTIADENEQRLGEMGYGGGGRGRYPMKPLGISRVEETASLGMVADMDLSAPMAARAPMAAESFMKREKEAPGSAPVGETQQVQPMIRTAFADAAFWAASLQTDADGNAQIELTMPDNLTGWKVKSWAMGHGTKVAQAETIITTKKNLMIRMQAPRFFVEKDEVVLSANIHNYLKNKKEVKAVLELEGGCLELSTSIFKAGRVKSDGSQEIEPMLMREEPAKTLTIEAGGEQRVDWRVKVLKEGEAVIRMSALTDEESDAMQMKYPVYVHGMDKMVSFSGYIRPDKESASITLEVPKDRRQDASRLEIRYSPTLAGAMVDALPYLVDYPYGCTEQTLSRFLPTVITQKVLMNMGINLKDVRDKRTNLNAQEIGDDTERAKQWRRYKEASGAFKNPVFDEAEVQRMVKSGVEALTQMQLTDGGWGWFSGYGEHSSPHTTAHVVHGLQIARENDVALVPGVLERGVEWLKNYQAQELQKIKNWEKDKGKTQPYKSHADNLDAFVYMVLCDAGVNNDEMREFLYRDRNELAVYAKAMFGLGLQRQVPILAAEVTSRADSREGQIVEQRDMLIQNIEQILVRDEENQTAYLNLGNGGYWWCWYGSEYEAQGYYLKLLAKTGRVTDWKAPYLVKYLLNNRKHATYWNSTRDTAVCVEAFADYLKASKEDKPDLTVEILVDGKKQKEVRITAENLFTFDNQFVMFGDAVETGKHKVEFRKKGTGPLYFNAYLSYFSLEDFITKAGLEVKVDRQVYKLTKAGKTTQVAGQRGQVVDQKVEKYDRNLLKSDDSLKSGDLVEVELVIESKNDYEYLVFEDMKAAGFEPVEVRSGYTGNDMGAYVEFRDNRVVFFVQTLARGKHSVSYRLRAEIPGRFSALPARGYAMYAPELRGNSDEIKLKIED